MFLIVFITVLIIGAIAMSIYFGNTKIGRIFVGSTEIGKVYKGSELVFENKKKVTAYGYNGRYLLGSNSTSGIVTDTNTATISIISGTLGASNSTVTFSNDQFTYNTYNYATTKTYNGVKIYVYRHTTSNFWYAYYVMQDAKVGSKCARYSRQIDKSYGPDSVTSSGFTVGSSTYARVAANDTVYTRDGFE